jgi:site-specific DNA recombinase
MTMTTTDQEGRKPLLIAAYCRVASRAPADQQAGIEAQQSAINRSIEDRKQRDGWQVESLTIFTDAGESARNQNRPGLQQLRQAVAGGRLDMVLCTKFDRLTRSVSDFAALCEHLQRHGVCLVSTQSRWIRQKRRAR